MKWHTGRFIPILLLFLVIHDTDLLVFIFKWTHYDIDEAGMHYVLETAHMIWKDYKADLKKKYFDATLTDEELMDRRDSRVNEIQWEWLIDHWKSPEAMAHSIRGKENRGKLRILHTAGSKSHARVGHDLGLKLGHPARRDEVWVETHKRKNGEVIPEAVETFELLKDIAETYPELKEKTIQKGDLYARVCGMKEPRGHVRVLGKGLTPQDVGTPGPCTRIPTRLQLEMEAHRQTKQELVCLNQRMDDMQQLFNAMEQMVMSQGVQNIETSSQHASNSRLVESPRSQGLEELYHTNQQEHHSQPTIRHLNTLLGKNDSIIRRKVINPMVSSKTIVTRRQEPPNVAEENLVGRDVILYAALRTEIHVAKATIVSIDPNHLVGGQPLGVQFYEVVVNVVLKRDALLPRPYDSMEIMADAQYTSIAWPSNRLKVTKSSNISKSAGV